MCPFGTIRLERVKGKVPITQRTNNMKLFNDMNNVRSRLYLISTLAGGMDVNLYSANRVIILDTSWNPALFSMIIHLNNTID